MSLSMSGKYPNPRWGPQAQVMLGNRFNLGLMLLSFVAPSFAELIGSRPVWSCASVGSEIIEASLFIIGIFFVSCLIFPGSTTDWERDLCKRMNKDKSVEKRVMLRMANCNKKWTQTCDILIHAIVLVPSACGLFRSWEYFDCWMLSDLIDQQQ